MEFAADSLALWQRFVRGMDTLVLSAHTLRELQGAPDSVRARLTEVPDEHVVVFSDTDEAYLSRGVVGPGSRADALHVALATVGRVDVMVSWNFRHIVNLGRIRLFQAVNLEKGYGLIEIRSPKGCSSMNDRFRAVEWMRQKRTLTDNLGLTWPEKSRRTQQLLEEDPLWQRLKKRAIAPVPAVVVPKKT
jgi:hypothetical protein